MVDKAAAEIIEFWFSEPMNKHWFVKSDAIDAQITKNFSDLYQQAKSGELDGWRNDPQSALALVLLLDQFPRNMFRGTPQAFATDKQACELATDALARGFDKHFSNIERQFFYLPFMHSETLADQQRSMDLYTKLGDENALDFAQQHCVIIEKFNRFPHRNIVVGRETTQEEAEYLKIHPGF